MADTEPNYYHVLGVATGATPAEVKAAHKRLIKIWHPDKNPDRVQEATARSSLINRARDVLSDPLLRTAYDERHVVPKRGADGMGRSPSPAGRGPDAEVQRQREERARWRAQPEPDLAFTDVAFVRGHWYAHPEKGKYLVEEVTADRAHIRFRDGARTRFVTSRLWASWLSYLHSQGRVNGRSSAADPATSAEGGRERQQSAAKEDARRARERTEWDGAERRHREAQRRAQQDAEARARREAEEYAKRVAEARARQEEEAAQRAAQERARRETEARIRREVERRQRQALGKQHRDRLLARTAQEQRDREERRRQEAGEPARRPAPLRTKPRRQDPLGWTDSDFVAGHWYADEASVYEIVGVHGEHIRIRYPDGEERDAHRLLLWRTWTELKATLTAGRNSPETAADHQEPAVGEGVIATADRIARESGALAAAHFLASVGWVRLVDRRPERGPLIAVPSEPSRDRVDRLFAELKRRGSPLLHAKGGAGVTDGKPAWIVR